MVCSDFRIGGGGRSSLGSGYCRQHHGDCNVHAQAALPCRHRSVAAASRGRISASALIGSAPPGGARAPLAAPGPRLAAPPTIIPTITPSVSPGSATPAAPSTSLSPTPLSPTPSAGLTPPGGVAATTTPTTALPGSNAPS